MGFRLKILALLPLLWAQLAFAGVDQISENEFRTLASELAPKVNLFHATWEKDPNAEFYGGTTRDYLYWLKGQFRLAKNPVEAAAVETKLRALPVIDVRDFIIGDSDVDIIGSTSTDIRAENFGVRKIDFQSSEILDPSTVLGKNEILQGYIPAEKIRLGRGGIRPALGDGASEIYHGKLSVHFASAEDFAKSKYAQEGINHPILLALRYLRVQAINYFRSHGSEFPDRNLLFHEGMDAQSAAAVKKVIAEASEPDALKNYLAQSKFKSWINGGIQKAFRSYTNPTAAMELMREFGVQRLPELYPHEIETLNQYIFSKHRDPATVAAALKKYGVNEKEFYRPIPEYFSDGKLYHGTKTEEAFRSIVFQGVFPSGSGNAGAGLYGVSEKNKEFSEHWGGNRERLLSFHLNPDARLVDITKGEGERVWDRVSHNGHEAFADLFGVDIIRYPYKTEAFVVENGSILSDVQGVHRSLMSVSQMAENAKGVSDLRTILKWFSINRISSAEEDMIWRASKVSAQDVAQVLSMAGVPEEVFEKLTQSGYWLGKPEVQKKVLGWLNGGLPKLFSLAVNRLAAHPEVFNDPETSRLLERFATKTQLAPVISSNIENEILHFFAAKKIDSPGMRKLALDFAKDEDAHFTSALEYLASVPLTKEEAEALLALIGKASEITPNAQRRIAELLANHGYGIEEFRDKTLRKLAADIPNYHSYTYRDRWEDIFFLRGQFPADERVKDAASVFFNENIYELGPQGLWDIRFEHVLPKIGDDPRIKNALLETVKIPMGGLVHAGIIGLSYFPLTDEDLITIFESQLPSKDVEGTIGPLLLKRKPISEKLQQAMIRFILRGTHKSFWISSLGLPENEGAVSNYLEQLTDQLLKGEEILGVEGLHGGMPKGARALLSTLSELPLTPSPRFAEKSLSLLEKSFRPGNEVNDWLAQQFLLHLNLAESSMPSRVEAFLLKNNLFASTFHMLPKIALQIPQPSAEFRKMVADGVAEEYRNRSGDISPIEPEIRALEKYLKDTEHSSAQMGTCAGNFAQLAP